MNIRLPHILEVCIFVFIGFVCMLLAGVFVFSSVQVNDVSEVMAVQHEDYTSCTSDDTIVSDHSAIGNRFYDYTSSLKMLDANEKWSRKVNMNLIVFTSDDVDDVVRYISEFIGDHGGSILNLSINYNDNRDYGSIIVDIPNDAIDLFLSGADQQTFEVGKINDSYECITNDYIKLEAEIEVKEVEKESYIELLGSTNDEEHIISLQEKLNDVLNDLGSLQNKMKLLNDRDMHTEIKIDISSLKFIF